MTTTRQNFLWGWGRLPTTSTFSQSQSQHSQHLYSNSRGRPLSSSPDLVDSPTNHSAAPSTPLPRLLEALETATSLRSIHAATNHVIAVTNSGEMYSWGPYGPAVIEEEHNDQQHSNNSNSVNLALNSSVPPPSIPSSSASLGSLPEHVAFISDSAPLHFRSVYGMEDKGIYHISLMNEAMLAITAANDVFAWKWNQPKSSKESQQNNNNNTNNIENSNIMSNSSTSDPTVESLFPEVFFLPHLIPVFTSLSCTSISCGSDFTLLLTSAGQLYSMGSGSHGRLGTGSFFDSHSPVLVDIGDKLVTRISAGFAHAAAITHTGALLTWGCGLNGRLGNGRISCEDQIIPLSVSADLDTPVVDVHCGYHHSLCLDVNGRVWSFGGNSHGECGLGDDLGQVDNPVPAMRCSPVCIETIGEQVVCISCGAYHSACITAVGQLLMWGWNRFGMLGIGNFEAQSTPTLVTALSGMDVCLVTCAGDYTVAVTDHFMSIEPNYFLADMHQVDDLPFTASPKPANPKSNTNSISPNTKSPATEFPDDHFAVEEDADNTDSSSTHQSSAFSQTTVVRSISASMDVASSSAPNHGNIPVVFEEDPQHHSPLKESDNLSSAVRIRSQSSPNKLPKRKKKGRGTASIKPPALTANTTSGILSPTEALSPTIPRKTLLSLVKDALMISPIPELITEDIPSPSFSRSESAASSASAFPSSSSSLGTVASGARRPSSSRSHAAAMLKMTDAYLTKLHRTAKHAASQRIEEQRRRAAEEKERAAEAKKHAKKEKLMEETATEWTKQIIPKWDQPKIRQRAKELASKVGIPAKVRGQVWLVAIGNTLMINADLYKIFGERANRFKIKKRQQNQQQQAQYQQQLAAATTGTSLTTPESSMTHSDSALEDLRAFGKENTVSYIDSDLARTFPSLAFFQDECAMNDQLRTILYTYCFYRPDVGYVQGMSYLAAYLLLYMTPFKAFIAFANLLNSPFFHCFLKLNAQQTQARYELYLDILHEHQPQLHFHLAAQSVLPELYLLEWAMTLFSKRLKLEVVGRIWDLYVMHGEMIVYRVAVSILTLLKPSIINEDMGAILKRLSVGGMELNEDDLMQEVNKVVIAEKFVQRLATIAAVKEEEVTL